MLQGKKVLVVGSGISGIGAVMLLQKMGAMPILFDENKKMTEELLQQKLPGGVNAVCYAGSLPEQAAGELSAVVLSPGVPTDTDFVNAMRERGLPILGEIELGYLAEQGTVIAITGTNGKTTTTTLVGEIMKACYEKVFVVGNIGNPYTLEADCTTSDSVTVGEISSFQLETIHRFHPRVSAILNITPDHLDRHHTMEGYVAAKEAIARNQTEADVCVLNYDNEYTRNFGERCTARVVWFSSSDEPDQGYFLRGRKICRKNAEGIRELLDRYEDINLVGLCNVENVMAAMAIAEAMGVPETIVLDVIKRFRAVEHRIEYVDTKRGVRYYNDSKGTNPDAAIQGIRAMDCPTVLIGGGYDKQSEYDEWIQAFEGKVKCLVLIGQTREKIAACAKKHGVDHVVLADTFEEAFRICVQEAQSGEAVLLSPACASWGMFPSYEVRGKMFKDMVNELEE